MELIKWLLDYAATNPGAVLTYESSDMILAVHSDASYLSEANVRSQVGGHFFCSSNVSEPPNNKAVLNISKILKAFMSSAAEAELGALYISASETVPCANSLQKWATNNPRLPFKQTTQLRAGSSITTSNHNAPKPWTCVFTGFVVVTPKDNSDTTGVLESTTEPTTGTNTTAPLTTLKRGQKS
jgi:hypothetical protein